MAYAGKVGVENLLYFGPKVTDALQFGLAFHGGGGRTYHGGGEQISDRLRSALACGYVPRQASAGSQRRADGFTTEPLPPGKNDVVVVDFTNNAKEILKAFAKYRKGAPFEPEEPDQETCPNQFPGRRKAVAGPK